MFQKVVVSSAVDSRAQLAGSVAVSGPPCGTHSRRPCVTGHQHWLSFVYSWRPCCSAELWNTIIASLSRLQFRLYCLRTQMYLLTYLRGLTDLVLISSVCV